MDLALITNGQLLSPKMSAKLIKAGLTRLMVSVDAASQETYQITRPGGDWGLLWANIGAFLAIRSSLNSPLPLLRLSFVEMTLNQNERVKFQEDFGEMADYLSFQKYQNILGLKRTNWGLSAPSPGFCPDPLTRLTLFANGSLFPCCSDFGRKASLGHFPEKTLAEAWNSPLAVALARDQGWAANCQECQRASDPTILGSATVSQTHHRDQSLDQLIEQPWPNILGSAPSQARVPEGR
jgi:radical SAM protein with 4Fe4S-binding SPASM domain